MQIDSLKQRGFILKETRVSQKISTQDLAVALQTSHTLLRRLEHGEPTKALEMLFATIQELGIELHVELPPNVHIEKDKPLSGIQHYSRAKLPATASPPWPCLSH